MFVCHWMILGLFVAGQISPQSALQSDGIDNFATDSVATLEPREQNDIPKVAAGCRPVPAGDPGKLICVCSERHCDQLDFRWPERQGEAVMVQSSKSGARFQTETLAERQWISGDRRQLSAVNPAVTRVRVDLSRKQQSILGWGGAFTDAACINIGNLTEDLAAKVIESYYGEHGLQYNFGRVPIGGSDFSTHPYSYDDDQSPDYELKNWKLPESDLHLRIPYLQMAKRMAQEAGVELKLFGSPWSPPQWMKTNKNFIRGSLIDDDKVYKSYAEYLMRFYDAYEQKGLQFWGATVQNEPVAAFLPIYFFNSLQFGNKQMTKFIGQYLGPALEARNKTKENFKLMVGDDSLGFVNLQVPALMAEPSVQKYVSGFGFHWYTSGSVVPYSALTRVHDAIKDKIEFMLMTEACTGSMPMQKKVDLGSWDRAEQYSVDIIEDLLRQTNGWIDWNLALDLNGGPNWAKNFVDAPILVNKAKNEFYKQPMYYALAHFSRLFRPGSVRVETQIEGTTMSLTRSNSGNNLKVVAVINEQTNHLILNILNKSRTKQRLDIIIDGLDKEFPSQELKSVVVEAKSISSIVLKL